MSDFFGIGAGIKGCIGVYLIAARNTGRTISMINSLQKGDRVVFASSKEAQRVERLCKERGIDIEYIIVAPKHPHQLFEIGTPQRRTIFDHSWVEQFYLDNIDRAENQLSRWRDELSGYGEKHIETRKKAEEFMKWQQHWPELKKG